VPTLQLGDQAAPHPAPKQREAGLSPDGARRTGPDGDPASERPVPVPGGEHASVLARWLPKNITGQIETADDLPQDAGLHSVAFVR